MGPLFADRTDAGRRLATLLSPYAREPRAKDGAEPGNRPQGAMVLALPRGGVPVGYEVAKALNLALDVFLVRKLGVPGQEELAMGAVAAGGVLVLNQDVIRHLGIPPRVIEAVEARERRVLEERNRLYRGDRPPPDLRGRTAILVDDGLATGSSMKAAIGALEGHGPARIVVAVPVAPSDTVAELAQEVHEVVAAATPEPFYGVGRWYECFDQTSDDEVRELLERAAAVTVGTRWS